jgi:hypothetical protein
VTVPLVRENIEDQFLELMNRTEIRIFPRGSGQILVSLGSVMTRRLIFIYFCGVLVYNSCHYIYDIYVYLGNQASECKEDHKPVLYRTVVVSVLIILYDSLPMMGGIRSFLVLLRPNKRSCRYV